MRDGEFAEMLALARRRRTKTAVAPDLPDVAAAYRVQELAATAYGAARIGYKIGATSAKVQRIVGCDGPFFGPLFDADLVAAGATVPVDETMLGLECEFAFRMARPFPAGEEVVDAAAAADAAARCVAAFEIVGSRIAGDGIPPAARCIADFGLNADFCPGPDIAGWRELDLAAVSVEAEVDGERTNAGAGAEVLGDPLAALAWLGRELGRHGRRLEEGDWVSTGTCLGVIPVKRGSTVMARFSCGVEMTLSFA